MDVRDEIQTKGKVGAPAAVRRAALTAAVVLFGLAWVLASASAPAPGVYAPVPDASASSGAEEGKDWSRFNHSNPMHNRLPCLLCHVRQDNAARPKRTAHMPCAGCHMEQFAKNEGPMCAICHNDEKGAGLKAFPPLRSFSSKFNHQVHARQTGCATCHRPSRGGVALSVPAGIRAHTTCYQCHGPKTVIGERNIGSCGVCHEPGRPVRNSDRAKAYTFNFSHAKHRKDMSCAACHQVRPGSARDRQVTEPLAAMHFAPPNVRSCASCHNKKDAFGEDFSDCKSCHTGPTFSFR